MPYLGKEGRTRDVHAGICMKCGSCVSQAGNAFSECLLVMTGKKGGEVERGVVFAPPGPSQGGAFLHVGINGAWYEMCIAVEELLNDLMTWDKFSGSSVT
eukprot:4290411-Ditylum_brightwellii.AAC.1